MGIFYFLGSLASGILSIFTRLGIITIIIKTLILTAFTVILTTVLYNVYYRIMNEILTWALNYIDSQYGEMPELAYQFTGLGAWLYTNLQIGECISLISTGISIAWVLRLLRLKK